MRPVVHSFVVGITPEGRRVPLMVGTIGEARGAADGARAAGGVYEGVFYPYVFTVEGVRETSGAEYAAPPAGYVPPEPRTSAVSDAGAEAGAPSERAATSERGDGGALREQPATTATREPDGVTAAAPEENPETREEYAARLAGLPRPKLMEESLKFPALKLKSGVSNADLRQFLVEAKFPVVSAQ